MTIDLDRASVPHTVPVEDCAADGECLLYDPARDQASALNRTATEIWRLCDGTRSIAAIARVLGERYGVDQGALLEDVLLAVSDFRARGLVRLARQPANDQG
jgi:hypothetical protein